ncbi:MAG TPA: hypothetical protein VFQ36_06905 [Ktedonobacteraceae bacterium]|nr:hypothetical protein [Ktedonobacteraceae bacterium]
MSHTFEEQYAPMLKEVFTSRARQQLQQGADGVALARGYAEHGKPDFALACLLLLDIPDGEKREMLAYAYERRARLSDEKARQLDKQFHRSFPLIKLGAQNDRKLAVAIRSGQAVFPVDVPPDD